MSYLRRAVVRANRQHRFRCLPEEAGGAAIFLPSPLVSAFRRVLLSLALAGLFASAAVPLVFTATGCATQATAQRKTFTSIDDVAEGVKTAMLGFNALYQAGSFTEADRQRVLDAYAVYQKAAELAVHVGKDLSQGDNALRIASDAAWPLLDLIATLKAKVK